jgi:GNAT superfamily N-acetyltransferase
MPHVRRLARQEMPRYLDHLLSLDPVSRAARFMSPGIGEVGIRRYVEGLGFDHAVLAAFDSRLAVVGAAHVGPEKRSVEIGVSVSSGARGTGLGRTLVMRAALWARNRGYVEALTYCSSENCVMARLIRSMGGRVAISEDGWRASLALPPADSLSWAEEIRMEATGWFSTTALAPFAAWDRTLAFAAP